MLEGVLKETKMRRAKAAVNTTNITYTSTSTIDK